MAARALEGWAAARGITPTERLVAEHAFRGLSNKEIASALGIAVSTVRTHLLSVCQKSDVNSRGELAHQLFELIHSSEWRAAAEEQRLRREAERARELARAEAAERGKLLTERDRLLNEVENQRALLEAVLREMPVGVAIARPRTGELLLSNEELERIQGASGIASIDDLVRCPLEREDGTPLDVAEMPLVRALAGEDVPALELQCTTADGRRRVLLVEAKQVRNARGEMIACVRTAVDLTACRHARARLEDQSRLLDLANEAIVVRELGGVVRHWYAGAERLYGISSAAAVGRSLHELLKTRFPEPIERVNAVLARDGCWQGELVHTRADGREVRVESRWVLCPPESGEPARVLEVDRDVSARSRARAPRAAAPVEALPPIQFAARSDGSWSVASAPFFAFLERAGDDDVAAARRASLLEDDALALARELDRARSLCRSFERRVRMRSGDHAVRWFLERWSPVVGKDGAVVSWIGACVDIDALVHAEESARELASVRAELERKASRALSSLSPIESDLGPGRADQGTPGDERV